MRYRLHGSRYAHSAHGHLVSRYLHQQSLRKTPAALAIDSRSGRSQVWHVSGLASRVDRRCYNTSTVKRKSDDDAPKRIAPKNKEWLSFEFDESVPAQVQLAGWALKVLDIVQAVSASDAAKLRSSLERYQTAANADSSESVGKVHADAEEDLVVDFEDVWSRTEQRFREHLRQQEEAEKPPEDINLLREVSDILQRLHENGDKDLDASNEGNIPEPNAKEEGEESWEDSSEPEEHGRFKAESKTEETEAVQFPDLANARRLLDAGTLFSYTHGYQGKLPKLQLSPDCDLSESQRRDLELSLGVLAAYRYTGILGMPFYLSLEALVERINSSSRSETTTQAVRRLVRQTDEFVREIQAPVQRLLQSTKSQGLGVTTVTSKKALRFQQASQRIRGKDILQAMENFRLKDSAETTDQHDAAHSPHRNAEGESAPAVNVEDLSPEREETSNSPGHKESITPDDVEKLDVPMKVAQYQAAETKRFMSEMAREWIRKTKLRQEIIKADAEAQSKLKQFHLYSARNTGVSSADLEKVKAEYEMVAERYRLLSGELENEDNVIIRHKPSKIAPIIIPASASRSIAVEAEPEPPAEYTAPPERSVPYEPNPITSEPNPSRTHEGQDCKETAPKFMPVAKKSLPEVAPVMPPQKGLFSSIYRVYNRIVASLPTAWKAVIGRSRSEPSTKMKQLDTRDPLMTSASIASSTQPTGSAKMEPPKAKASFRSLRFLQAQADAQADPDIESTDWGSLGYDSYGQWLASRIHKPITARESAYISHLASASLVSPFKPNMKDRTMWQSHIAKMAKDHTPYASEVADPRIQTHLGEVLPQPYRNTEQANDGSQTSQQLEAIRILEELCDIDNVLEVYTDGSFWEAKTGQAHSSHSGGGIFIKATPDQIRERCYMGSMMRWASEAEIGALYRGLQIVRNTLNREGNTHGTPRYRRIVVATDSRNALESLSGYTMQGGGHWKMTRIAALCRIEAYEIVKANEGIDGIHFIWLPRETEGLAVADLLARSGRLSVYNFV